MLALIGFGYTDWLAQYWTSSYGPCGYGQFGLQGKMAQHSM